MGVSVAGAGSGPWRPRRRPGIRPNYAANGRVVPKDWPAEPKSPSKIDAKRFAKALRNLCGFMPPGRATKYAGWMLQYGAQFGEDPFLLAGIVHRQSRCRPTVEDQGGLGLTLIRREMHPNLRKGKYSYRIRQGKGWADRTLVVDRFPFAGPRLLRAEENIYFAAAILAVWRTQHDTIDAEFRQVPHRHHVSHFYWGDRVRSQRDEDRFLLDRRRMLFHYGALPEEKTASVRGVTLGSPLEGAPRVVSSGLGDERDGGDRSHRGADIESIYGEPVRAVADGDVVFAGVDLPGRQNNVQVRKDEYDEHPRRSLGNGGRFVCLRHHPTSGSLRSCYMHLETVEVEAGTTIRRGDVLGTVGRTGMRTSAPHLHFELHDDEGIADPRALLPGILIGDPSADPAYPPSQ